MLHIDPQKKLKSGFDYHELKKEGLRLIEQYCGGVWTDYNEHDPGITILEQLIFALTELSYRTDFEIKEILTDYLKGDIPEYEQVLLSADEIMPCTPLTQKDYTKLLYDNIYGLANVWLKPIPVSKYGVNGLYKISVYVYDLPKYQSEEARKKIKSDIRILLADNRNLGEDFQEVELLEYVDFFIEADIETTSENLPEQILAEIFFKISNHVAPEVRFYSYLELRDEGRTIDEIFTGPALKHGFINEEDLGKRPEKIYDTQVIDIINGIKGVKSIKNLRLSLNGIQFTTQVFIKDSQILRYKFDATSKESVERIRFYKGSNTRQIEVSAKRTKQELDNLIAIHRRVYKLDEQYKRHLDLPRGSKIKFDTYHSVQNQFPHIYGINHFGIPSSESYLRKAQAKQLKAYLMIYEQIMTNYLSQLAHTRDLFSIRNENESTYFYNILDKNVIPHVKDLYVSDYDELTDYDIPKELAYKIDKIVDKYDDNLTRKNKFLDYLLSLYGERFYQFSLSRLNYYYSESQNEKNVIRNKIKFLRDINRINKKRGTGYNYLRPYAIDGNISGVEFKVKMLLEINGSLSSFDGCSLLSVFKSNGLKLVSEHLALKYDCYEFDEEGGVLSAPIDKSTVDYFFEGVSFEKDLELSEEEILSLLEKISFIQHRVIDETILRAAVNIKNYKIGKLISSDSYEIVLKTDDGLGKIWKRIGFYKGYEDTKKAIYALINFTKELNIESEDFHVVEHVLLRPDEKRDHTLHDWEFLNETRAKEQEDFYSFRASIVLPDWTARFNDDRFRSLAMETFHLNMPAHIAVDYLWLSPEEMCDFETHYCGWLSKRAGEESTKEEVDAQAMHVEHFLRKYKAQQK